MPEGFILFLLWYVLMQGEYEELASQIMSIVERIVSKTKVRILNAL